MLRCMHGCVASGHEDIDESDKNTTSCVEKSHLDCLHCIEPKVVAQSGLVADESAEALHQPRIRLWVWGDG